MMSGVLAEYLKSVLPTCKKNRIRALYALTQAFRLPIASAVFRYYCIVLMYRSVLYRLSETILANLNKPEDPCGSILICPHFYFPTWNSSLVIIRCYLGTQKLLVPFFFYRMIRRCLWYCFTRGSCGNPGAEFGQCWNERRVAR